ncbi:MAG: hypothetical protein RL117_525 [Verrucomicrobiota bacterium]|jgi:2-dehydropantoate 2-reductase
MFSSIAIVGAGAIGLYYGGRLAEAGHRVSFLLRSDFDAVKQHGLHVDSIDGSFHLPQPLIAQRPEEIGPVDLVIVAWKATSNFLLEKILPPLLHDGTQVITLQNGMGNVEAIAAITGPERVLAGLCFVCINRIAPGQIRHTTGGRMAIGELMPAIPDRAATLARMFRDAKIEASVEPNVEETAWKKLIWNVPFNGLAITAGGKTTDQLLAEPAIEKEIRALMAEVVQAAHARGFAISPHLIETNIERTRPMGPYRPSSLIDWQEGREVEIDAIWREPLRRAHTAGLHLPHWEKLLKNLEFTLGGQSSHGNIFTLC